MILSENRYTLFRIMRQAQGDCCFELSLELARLLGAGPERDWHLSRHAAVRACADDRDRALRLDHSARFRSHHRRAANIAVEDRGLDRLCLCRILPQHAFAGAVVPLVLRAAGTAAARLGTLAEATAPCAVLYGGDRNRTVHVGARRRTDACRYQLAAARTEACRHRAWSDHGADLSLRSAADGVPYHPAAAHFRIPLHDQEYLGGAHHRSDRIDRRSAGDAG